MFVLDTLGYYMLDMNRPYSLNAFATEMADLPNVAPTGTNNETQTLPTTVETTTLSVSPTRNSPEPLYYLTGQARVIRTLGRNNRSSRAGPYQNPASTRTRRWDWLPTTLNTWRSEEEIQIPTDPMDISSYTQEPIHHTVPVLAARLHRHEERLECLEREQYEARMFWMHQAHERIAQLFQDQENLTETVEMIHQQVIDDRGAVDTLQASLEECELRSQDAEQHSSMLEQRLIVVEENARQAGRLAETVERLVTLMSRINLRQN